MSEPDQTPIWHQAMREDTRRPPTWTQWSERHGRWRAIFLLPEWGSEWTVHWSHSWDFVKVLELIGKFTLLFSVVVGAWTYFAEADEREKARQDAIKAKHYRAWELIYTAQGSFGDGGRQDALRDLAGDHVSLAGVPLSKANLSGLELPRALLYRADLSEADLSGAYLAGAYLAGAKLREAKLFGANLTGADLTRANLIQANLHGANLPRANLLGADLSGAFLFEAHMSDTDLSGAIFCNTTMPDGSIINSNCPSEPSTSDAHSNTAPNSSASAPASPEP